MDRPLARGTVWLRLPARRRAYAAKSTADTHGSIPDQLHDAQALAERDGYEVVARYQDEAASAYHGNRGDGLRDARAHAERLAAEHGACALIVQHSDRLARGDGVEAEHLVEHVLWARRVGVTLLSVQDAATFGNDGLIHAALMGDRNHEDSKRKSKSVKDGLRRRRERRQSLGPPADGYRLEQAIDDDGRGRVTDSGKVINRRVRCPERAPVIERIFDEVEAGATFGEVARGLNREGVLTRGYGTRPPGRWETRRVREIVLNPAYAGLVADATTGELVRGELLDALIDADRWRRITDSLTRLDPEAVLRRKGGRPSTQPYLLRRIARCARCGDGMWTREYTGGRGQQPGRHYVCSNVRGATGKCSAPAVPADVAEAVLLERLDWLEDELRAFVEERAASARSERDEFAAAVDRQRAIVARLDRRVSAASAQYDRLLDAG